MFAIVKLTRNAAQRTQCQNPSYEILMNTQTFLELLRSLSPQTVRYFVPILINGE